MSLVAESNTFIKEKENHHNTLNTKFNDISLIFIYLLKMIEKFENFGINQHNLGMGNYYIAILIY